MPRPRFQRLDPARQTAVLDAAAEEFAARGYEGASYNRIIERSGVSKGAMYYYFEDKADLYATVLGRALEGLGGKIGDLEVASDAAEFWDQLASLLRRAASVLLAEPELVALVRGLYRAPPEVSGGALGEVLEASTGWFARTLERGRKVGAVRDDVPADLLTVAATGMCFGMDRWLAEHWDDLDADRLEALEPAVLDLVRGLLEPRRTNP